MPQDTGGMEMVCGDCGWRGQESTWRSECKGFPCELKRMDTPMSNSELLPAKALFSNGKVPGPLTEEERQWLVKQLAAYPKRVNEARTCCIGPLTDMATTEFCRLMADRTQLDELRAALEPFAKCAAQLKNRTDFGDKVIVSVGQTVLTLDDFNQARKALGGTNG